jgi:hypothetical protein
MSDHPFESLREALLRMGVAPRHARRTVLELDSHFRQLVQEGLQRGASEEAARIAARVLRSERGALRIRRSVLRRCVFVARDSGERQQQGGSENTGI